MSARQIFVSYSRRDREVVKALCATLKVAGAGVFRDEDSIEPGEEWAKVLVRNIETCDRMALFWSANAAASEQVTAEWMLALHYQKGVAPFLLDKTPIPEKLQRFHHIDFSEIVSVQKIQVPVVSDQISELRKAPTSNLWKAYLSVALGVIFPPALPVATAVYLTLNANERKREQLASMASALLSH